MICKVYTGVGGIKPLYHVCPPVRKIIHSLKLVDYLHVQADNPWYNYYLNQSRALANYVYTCIINSATMLVSPVWHFNGKKKKKKKKKKKDRR